MNRFKVSNAFSQMVMMLIYVLPYLLLKNVVWTFIYDLNLIYTYFSFQACYRLLLSSEKEQQKGRKFINTGFRKQESDSDGFILENLAYYRLNLYLFC